MDFQHRPGGKTGSGGMMSVTDSNMQRRERQRRLAMETIDLTKDPYFFKNHLGSYECRLCLTLHMNEGSYLAHTQGKKHQVNLQRRIAREAKQGLVHQEVKQKLRKNLHIMKIGRPGYKVIKVSTSHWVLYVTEYIFYQTNNSRIQLKKQTNKVCSSKSNTRKFWREPNRLIAS